MAKDKNPSLDELKSGATSLTDEAQPNLDDDDNDIVMTEEPAAEDEKSVAYNGPGVVIDSPIQKEKQTRVVGPLGNKDTQDGVEKTLRDLDEQILEQHKRFLDITKGGTVVPPTDKNGRPVNPAKPEEVTVIIDKLGMGETMFTDEEKQRIEAAKRIKLVEVTNKELETVKIAKKFDREKQSKFVKQTFNRSLATVVAPASGYTAKLRNVSSAEALQILQRPGEDSAKSMLEKWSLIYDKVLEPSCGDFANFDDFIAKTAYVDYNNFIYAILCNSYPETDSISFTCNQPNCKKDFDVSYKNRDLIRKVDVSKEQVEVLTNLMNVASDADVNKCEEYRKENSILNNIVRFKLDDESGILVDVYVASVKEQVENIIPYITPDMVKVETSQRLVMLAHNIKSILLPATNDATSIKNIEYIEADSLSDIVYLLGQFNEYQLGVIERMINNMLAPYVIKYGIDNIVCPYCKHDYGEYPMNLDRLLFQRVQRRMQTELV